MIVGGTPPRVGGGTVRMRGPCAVRHDAVQWGACLGAVAAVGERERSCGEACHVWQRGGGGGGASFACADIVAYHWRSPGRHLWVDVAARSPRRTLAMHWLRCWVERRDVPGTAARLRKRKKHRKYGATVDRVGGYFRAAVMERFGAVEDGMQAI
eukprot:760818-Prymnesium_polylepis.2